MSHLTIKYHCCVVRRFDECNLAQYWDEDNGIYNVAGHEDDEGFKAKFWLRVLNSLCDPG